jgi:hypothetical protein
MAEFLKVADAPAIRETGRIMLLLTSLLDAAGRIGDADVALRDGIELLEYAAQVARRRAAH